jgi:hypothetical protein
MDTQPSTGAKYLVSGTWYQALGAKYLVPALPLVTTKFHQPHHFLALSPYSLTTIYHYMQLSLILQQYDILNRR